MLWGLCIYYLGTWTLRVEVVSSLEKPVITLQALKQKQGGKVHPNALLQVYRRYYGGLRGCQACLILGNLDLDSTGRHPEPQEPDLPIASIVVPFFWFNQFYIKDPKREPQKGTTMETIGRTSIRLDTAV